MIAVAISIPLILTLSGLRTNRSADCSSAPALSVSTNHLDKLDLAREPSAGKQQNFEKASAGSLNR
ncbi:MULTISPECIES: Flp family type IVb pilin [unclassified Bradyrhizobium]